jgi:4-hydroxy-3-methylbut-2-enyl diphosphate reductase
MVKKLSEAGVNAVDDLDLIKDEPVIIRSHGIPIKTLKMLKAKKNMIVDATCPYVAKAHEFAQMSDNEGYDIMILGNPAHPEIIALRSYIIEKNDGEQGNNDRVYIVENEKKDDTSVDGDSIVYNIPHTTFKKLAVICQTTQNIDNLRALTNHLLPITNELRIFNTICNATNVRQQSSLDMATHCSIMIVIGGKNSSNTLMLAKLCSEFTLTKHIEVAEELEKEWFDDVIEKKGCIGLTAGASTPDWIILDIYNKIKVITGAVDGFAESIYTIPGYKEEPNEYECSKRP